MDYPTDQVDELKKIAPNLSVAPEGGISYILITGFTLPDGCVPEIADVLLCPAPRDGYPSTLYYSTQINCSKSLNWNRANVRILDRNWFAVSWRVSSGLRLAELLLVHLRALRK